MKNYYANGYCTTGIRDGHDWDGHDRQFRDVATCRDCGITASNASIARGAFTHNNSPIPECSVPIAHAA